MVILASCGITYTVRTTKNELEEVLFTPCGKLGVALIGKGNSKFFILQRFTMKEPAMIFSDSLFVLYNHMPVKLHFSDERFLERNQLEIKDVEKIEAYFELDDGVFDGDTIAICASRYIQCMGDHVNLDTIYYTFSNRLRIHGVNAL
jgi:hypothetical protein